MSIEAAQNADGGWPYRVGRTSWTEPTVFALLSELAKGPADLEVVRKGARWLRNSQGSDGGWSPQPGVGQSTWVSGLVALLPEAIIGERQRKANIQWLLMQTGRESAWMFRMRQWLLGNQELKNGTEEGWPWFPGAAAWVMPTAIALAALRKEQAVRPGDKVHRRIIAGQAYLLGHACAEGGWNHGSSHALGYEAKAYPETTGVALLALRGVRSPIVDKGLDVAQRFLREPNPAGAAWLRLGLAAHGRDAVSPAPRERDEQGNVLDAAMLVLAQHPSYLLE